MGFLLKLIFLPILFIFSLLVFLPKEQMYNLLEEELAKKSIIVSNELREEKTFNLNISGAEVFYDGLNVSFISNIDFDFYLLKNSVNAKNIRISDSFSSFVPSKINTFDLEYSILNFNKVSINSKGEFGEFIGQVNLFDRKIVGELKPSSIMKNRYRNVLNQFKLVEGKYTYEQSF